MRSALEYGFLAPPIIFVVLCLVGTVTALIWRRTGTIIALSASLSLFVAATPAFSSYLLVCLESQIQNEADLSSAQAIVVLAADLRAGNTMSPSDVGPQTLERLLFAVDAYKQLHLPIAVTGGPDPRSGVPVAKMMKSKLEQYFDVPVTWVESQSRTTYENAIQTAQLLHGANIHTIVIITQARDAPRAIWSFEQVGLIALPWTAPRTALRIGRVTDFLPSINSLNESFLALHELIGILYYHMRY